MAQCVHLPKHRLRHGVERRQRHQAGRLCRIHESNAYGINNAGQVVGYRVSAGLATATEWSDGSIISLGSLPGSTSSVANGINDAGQAVG